MFTAYTFEDWQQNVANGKMYEFLDECISSYIGSGDFREAKIATGYYTGDDTEIDSKVILDPQRIKGVKEDGTPYVGIDKKKVVGNQIPSNFFRIFVIQENSFLLGNGVTLDTEETKVKLGTGFDTKLASMGLKSLVQKVCYGYWNLDHIEEIDAYTDDSSGAFALVDEMRSQPMVFVQFWQLSSEKPRYVRLFELDGMTVLKKDSTTNKYEEVEPKRAYILNRTVSAVENIVTGKNYGVLPVIPLYANSEHRSELTKSIKRKIDAYNVIVSDFGDNLNRANEVFWVLNNFGGSINEIIETMNIIKELNVVVNQSDGSGGGQTAEPKTIDVPYQARQTALGLLKKELYRDAMALDMDELTGGSLTNVAIKVAMTNLNLKCDDYEWQCFEFVQKVLALLGIETEQIKFKRRTLVNDKELIEAIYACRADIDLDTALKLNPLIEQDDIEQIKTNLDAERISGMPSMEQLNQALNEPESEE